MDCRKAQELIASCLLEGKEPEGHRGLSLHLQECGRCTEYFQRERKLGGALSRTLTLLGPPPDLAARVLGELERSREHPKQATPALRPRWQVFLWKGALGLATGIILALLVRLWQQETALPTSAPEPVAKVTGVSGEAELKRPGSSHWQRLEAGQQLLANHLLRTGVVGSLELDLKQGGKLHMHANSVLALHSAKGLALREGQIWLDLSTEGDPFVITFGQREATVSHGKIKLSVEPVAKLSSPQPGRAFAKTRPGHRASAQTSTSAIGWLDEL